MNMSSSSSPIIKWPLNDYVKCIAIIEGRRTGYDARQKDNDRESIFFFL